MKFIPFVQTWFSFSQVPHPMTLFLSQPCFFKKWLGGIRICWWILLRKSGETVVIAGPVFVHLLNLITFLVTFQLVKPLKDFSQPFDQVAPQVFVGRRLGTSEGPCNNIELVQFKGVRHFSLYLFQVHYTGTVGGYIFFFFNWDHFFFDLFANTCQSWKPEQQGTHMVSPLLFCSQVIMIILQPSSWLFVGSKYIYT